MLRVAVEHYVTMTDRSRVGPPNSGLVLAVLGRASRGPAPQHKPGRSADGTKAQAGGTLLGSSFAPEGRVPVGTFRCFAA